MSLSNILFVKVINRNLFESLVVRCVFI